MAKKEKQRNGCNTLVDLADSISGSLGHLGPTCYLGTRCERFEMKRTQRLHLTETDLYRAGWNSKGAMIFESSSARTPSYFCVHGVGPHRRRGTYSGFSPNISGLIQRMTNSHRLAAVRAHFRGWLADQTNGHESLEIISESLVVRDDFYCGRSFNTGTFRAVWFIEEDELKIHGADGTVVAVFQGDAINQVVAEESDDARPDVIKLDTMRSAASEASDAAKSTEADHGVAEAADESDDDDVRRAA